MNYFKLLFSTAFLLYGIGHFLYYYYFKDDKPTRKDGFLFTAIIKQHLAALVMIIFGLLGVYSELQKIL